jgi:DNA-binding NarL/FixJ family response regulator
MARKGDDLPVRIALVDDDEGVCAAVTEMAKSEYWTLDYYSDGYQAVQRIPFTHPDIVLMDIRMPGLSGIECTQKLKCHVSFLPIIMLTAYSDFESIIYSLMAGAVGYLLKPVSLEQFRDAITHVRHGGTALCEEAQTALLTCVHRAFSVGTRSDYSQRELQIMACLVQNMSDKEISDQLNIAPNTVHVHLVHLFKLLGAHNRNEAVQKFFQGCIENTCNHCRLVPPRNGDADRR